MGCKVNQYETDGIAVELIKNGWVQVKECGLAEVAIINTCTVTARAATQSRQAIRSIIRNNPGIRMIVTGCHAQTAQKQIQEIQGVDAVVGHKDKFSIAKAILSGNSFPDQIPEMDLVFHSFEPAVTGNNTRAYLKIQDGCNSFCSYCIVPYARGRSRSMSKKEVMNHLYSLENQGYKEAVLTGIHTGAWGLELDQPSTLGTLLKSILQERPIHRIRLSSIEPKELTDEIILLAKEHKGFCDHFHIPLQSGDDAILKRMGRPYDTAYFKELVLKIHQQIPFAAIGVDVMLGFPGESDEAFEGACQFIRDLPVSYLHVFPFSPREGTPAFDFKDRIPPDIAKKRCAIMRRIGEKKRKTFQDSNKNRRLVAVVQEKRDKATGLLKGVTSNYLPLLFEGPDTLQCRAVEVSFTKRDEKGNLLARVFK